MEDVQLRNKIKVKNKQASPGRDTRAWEKTKEETAHCSCIAVVFHLCGVCITVCGSDSDTESSCL